MDRAVLSFAGDQFAQVAIATLVYGQTHSAFLTALASLPLAGAPFSSARAALLPDALPRDMFVLGSAVGNVMFVSGMVNGNQFSLFGYFDSSGTYNGTANSIQVFDDIAGDGIYANYGLLVEQ